MAEPSSTPKAPADDPQAELRRLLRERGERLRTLTSWEELDAECALSEAAEEGNGFAGYSELLGELRVRRRQHSP
jgi:hypothetical protein